MADNVTPNNANQTGSSSWYDSIAQLVSDAENQVAAAGRTAEDFYDSAASAASDVYDTAGEVYDSLAAGANAVSDWLASDDTQTIPVLPPNQTLNQYVEVVRSDTPVEPVRAIQPVAARVHDEPGMMDRAYSTITGSVREAYDYVDSTSIGGAIIDGYQFFIPDAVEDYVATYFPPVEVNQEVSPPQVAQVQTSQAQAEESSWLDKAIGAVKSVIKAVTPDPVEKAVAGWFGYPPSEEVIVVVSVPQVEGSQPVAAAATNPTVAPAAQTQQAKSGTEANRSAQRVASSMQQGAENVPTGFATPDYASYYEEDFVTEDALAVAAEPSDLTVDEPIDFTTGETDGATVAATLAPVDGEEVSEGEDEEVLETTHQSAVVATLTTEENNSSEAGGVVVGSFSPAALALANGTSTLPTGTRGTSEGNTLTIAPRQSMPNELLEDFNGTHGNSALASHDQNETGDDVLRIPSVEEGDLEPGVEHATVLVASDDGQQEREGVAEIVEALPPQVSVQPHGILLTQVMDLAAARDAQTPDNPRMVAAYVGLRQAGVLADSGNDGDGGRVSHAAGEVYVRGNMNVSDEGGNSSRDGRDKTTEDIYAYADWLASRNTSWGRSATTSKRQSTV